MPERAAVVPGPLERAPEMPELAVALHEPVERALGLPERAVLPEPVEWLPGKPELEPFERGPGPAERAQGASELRRPLWYSIEVWSTARTTMGR